MKLTVLGATGGTGRQVVQQALGAGHTVTAVVRDPARLAVARAAGLDVVRADVADPTALAPLVAGRDAVLSALGTHGRGPRSVCADAARAAVRAMQEAGVRRGVWVSASAIERGDGDGALVRLAQPILATLLRQAYADLRAMESAVRASGLDWTVVRPPRLTDGPRTDGPRRTLDRTVPGGTVVSRADLAGAMLALLDDPSTFGRLVGVAR